MTHKIIIIYDCESERQIVMLGHRNRHWRWRSVGLLALFGVGIAAGLAGAPAAKAAPIGEPCDLFTGCVPKPPVLEDTYCCQLLFPVYNIVKVGRKKVYVHRGYNGAGCRVISSASGCQVGEERIACNGWSNEYLSPSGDLTCTNGQ